jgi:hypothetical protein
MVKIGRTDLARRLNQRFDTGLARWGAFEMLVRVLDHYDGSVDHRADRDGDPAQAHDVGAEAEQLHHAESHQDADRQHQDCNQRAAHMQQEG